MKAKTLISFLLIISSAILAQHNTFNIQAELQKFFERGGKVEEISPNIYKLTHLTGEYKTFNFNENNNANEFSGGIDTTIVNISDIDTTMFSDMFIYWQTVQVRNTFTSPMYIDDLNRNGSPELYGYSSYIDTGSVPRGGPVKIFERDVVGIFQNVFTYDPSTIYFQSFGDIHNSGGQEIVLRSRFAGNGVEVYRSAVPGKLPTTFDFIFYYEPNQINDMTFGDWDSNGITDCAFIDGAGAQHCIIAEYKDSMNNFETVFQFSTTQEGDLAGFAIKDFDGDNKNEFIVGSGNNGNIYVIENEIENQYSLIYQFQFPFLNAYMQTVTNDLDGNGKTEFWVGGQSFTQGITMYQCFESVGDNSYQPVAQVEIRYSVSFTTNYIQAVDMDDDGKEEIIISSGNRIFVLKFVGSPGEHFYKLWYAKLSEATQPVAEIYPTSIADLDGDSKKDILIPFRKYEEPIVFAFSYILRQDKSSSINSDDNGLLHEEFIFSYPNPFNSFTNISFKIKETSKVQLKIYNTLGKEISTLVDQIFSPGNYNLSWDGKNNLGNALSSGVYYIVLKSKNSVKTVKSILLK